MAERISIFKNNREISGQITLSGSKSISNRVLIIQALCDSPFEIENLSDSDDTKTLQKLLSSKEPILDAHHAGTTYRFLTSYIALKGLEVRLTGSSRMQERPIKALVDALQILGSTIEYTKVEGYPPLAFKRNTKIKGGKVTLPADVSSQFISSLLLIAPCLEDGLELTLEREIVSKPYIEMTLKIMHYFGIDYTWKNNIISIKNQAYTAKDFYVEADWSAASYYYSIGVLAESLDLTLVGLKKESLQGDSIMQEIGAQFGITSTFEGDKLLLHKSEASAPSFFEYDFTSCPDLAQSVSIMAGGIGTSMLISGIQTLKIKETNRITALKKELKKVFVYLSRLPDKFSKKSGIEYFMQDGKAQNDDLPPLFSTYNDHRMAMAFAPLALLFPIEIEDYKVVSKSYPGFWKDLETLGFKINTSYQLDDV